MTSPPTPGPAFNAVVERADGAAVVVAAGEVDIATTPRLLAAVEEALSSTSEPLVVDLSRVTFLESTGLRVLLETRKRMHEERRDLAIVCLPEGPVQRLFELTHTLEALQVFRSRDEALAAVVAG